MDYINYFYISLANILCYRYISVGKLKQFKKVSSDLKTILMTDFY